jgi:hypothetical protein
MRPHLVAANTCVDNLGQASRSTTLTDPATDDENKGGI